MICTYCNKNKTSQHFARNYLNGEVNPVCKNCTKREINTHKCIECSAIRKGICFTTSMIRGEADPVCHKCKGEKRGHAFTLTKKPEPNTLLKRKCLKCDKEFHAEHKFIRRCFNCKKNEDSY